MPSNEVIMFDLRVDRIRNDTDQVASLARTLAGRDVFADAWDKYNLEASERNLREAADRLANIRAQLATGVA